MSNKGTISVPMILTEQQERDIQRFYDTCEDGQDYDVPKDRMKSLARLGLIRTTGFSRYEITDAGDAVIEGLRSAPVLASRNKCGVQMVDCPECSHQWDHFFECGNTSAVQSQGAPVALTAVGVLRANGDGGLVPEWILEGGTAEPWDGVVLLVADTDPEQSTPAAEDERKKAIDEISEAINRMPYTRKHLAECLYDAGYRKQVTQ